MKYLVAFMVLNAFCAMASAEGNDKRRGPPMMNLTEEQRTCLESKIGKPGDGERPSREAMEAAFSACGVEKPKHKPGKNHRPPAQAEEDTTVTEE